MGQTIQIDIVNGFYQSDSLPLSNQRCVNLYPNIPQAPSLSPGALFNVQGLKEVATSSNLIRDSNRGGIVFNNVPYFLNGIRLQRLDQVVLPNFTSVYNLVDVGAVLGTGRVSFANNGQQIMMINSDGIGYIYNPDDSPNMQVINDPGFQANGKPLEVAFVDGYFIVTTDEKKAIVSAVNNGLDWNALDSITAESDPDDVVVPFVFNNQLYLCGTLTTEAFNNIGGAGVPFRRSGFFLPTGCSAPKSLVELGNQVMWLGRGKNEKPSIYLFSGQAAQKVSTTAIDNVLHSLRSDQIRNAFAWSYSLRGAMFVGFNIGDFTFVYDIATQRWHERQSIVRDSIGVKTTKRCRINSVLNAYNQLICGDSEDGRLGFIDEKVFLEYGEPLQSFFTTAPVFNNNLPFSLPIIELLCESGVGNELVKDPVARLEISRDGALFENPRTRELGRVGDRKLRLVWAKNGRVSQYCLFKVTISDPVKRRLYGLSVKIKPSAKV